jgi:hypothetical protein
MKIQPSHIQTRVKPRTRRDAALWSCGLLLALAGCADVSWPFHREIAPVTPAPDATPSDVASQCSNIQADIRTNEEARREAPTTTTYSDIVDAAQAKADKRIEDLQQRADTLDCPSDASAAPGRTPPLQPAPGGAPP